MTVNSETLHALLNQIEHIEIATPTHTWYDETGRPQRTHRYPTCPELQRPDQVKEVSRSTHPRPKEPEACTRCVAMADGSNEGYAHKAIRETQELRGRLLGARRNGWATIVAALPSLGRAHGDWRNFHRLAEAAGSDALTPPDSLRSAVTAQRQLTALGAWMNEAALRYAARQQATAAVAADDTVLLRYHCASSLASSGTGFMADRMGMGVIAPAFGGWDPTRVPYWDTVGKEQSQGGYVAFEAFLELLLRTGDLGQALDEARRLLHSRVDDRTWCEGYLKSWKTRLRDVESEQALAGNVTVTLAPLDRWFNPWHDREQLLLRWLDRIDTDGTITMTAPAVLADQICAAYALHGVGETLNRQPATLTATDDGNDRTLALVQRHWRPGGTERLTSVLADAKLVTA